MFVASTLLLLGPQPACLGAREVANQVEAMRFRSTSVAAMVWGPLKVLRPLLQVEERVLDWSRPVALVLQHRAV